MLKDSVRINDLLAWYGSLLTDNQKKIMLSYYGADLSLSEIADNNDVSRAAIFDTIKRSKELLNSYEEKLQIVKKFKQRSQQYDLLKKLNIEEVNEIVLELERIE